MAIKNLSTGKVAKLAGVSNQTVIRRIVRGCIPQWLWKRLQSGHYRLEFRAIKYI